MIDQMSYLRISLLKSCNLNCFYCRPPSDEMEKYQSANYENFKSSIKLFHTLGIKKIRFTGGEPTLYKKLPNLIQYIKEIDSSIHVGLTTNAVLMNQQARKLAECGLDSANISIDTLQKDKFCKVTGRDRWSDVQKGIQEAVLYIPKVKLNTVMIRSSNFEEADDLVQFANKLMVDIRFIEYMPTEHNTHNRTEYISGDELKESLPYSFEAVETHVTSAARYFKAPNLKIRVGFINPISHSFCSTCDRIRLASDGRLYGCLFSNTSFNLFESFKDGIDKTSDRISELIKNKTYSGCSLIDEKSHLPSFIKIGG